MKARIRKALGVLGEAVPVLVVASVVFLLIRNHLLEYYRIPSKSMAPTLHGDREHGDLVLVDKTAWWYGLPKPFDMVVVLNKTAPKDTSVHARHMVKRLVALGPANVTIQEGDLFLESPEGEERRVVKHPLEHRDLRVPVFEYGTGARCQTLFEDYFYLPTALGAERTGVVHLRAGSETLQELAMSLRREVRDRQRASGRLDADLPGHMGTRKPVDTSYLDVDGRSQWQGKAWRETWQPDVGIEIGVQVSGSVAGLQLVLEHFDRAVAVSYEVGGRVRLLVMGEPSGPAVMARPLAADKPIALALGYLDGHLFLTVGAGVGGEAGTEVGTELVLHRRLDLPRAELSKRQNSLHIGLAGGADARLQIRRIQVFHDVIYAADDRRIARLGKNLPYTIEHGQMFLLGDNTRDSLDSRDLENQPFELADLVGRPVMILAPGARRQMLSR